jgi:4-amino-4-deoxy-L-arabinose transferase-like glycosyltransferase
VKTDRRVLFLVCWFVPNLIFFTIAQSKLPTYTFFLFVTLALLMGNVLDQWISNGFKGKGERILAAVLAIVQTLAVLGAASAVTLMVPSDSNTFIKDISPVIYTVAALLSVPMILLIMRRPTCWTISSAIASGILFLLMQYSYADKVQEYTSTRGIAKELTKLRQGNEPVVSSSFIARAVTYYTGRQPEGVLFFPFPPEQTQPYFTPHPPLHMLRGPDGLNEFAAKNPNLLCVTQVRDMERLNAGKKSSLKGRCEALTTIGDRVVFRIRPAP